MPTPEELDGIYANVYAEDEIRAGTTHQESGTFAIQRYAEYVSQHLLNDKQISLLDYGAGSGEMVVELRRRGIAARGVEKSDSARAYCASSRNFALHPDLTTTADASLDFVTMIEVIEHLTDPLSVMLELRRKMRTGARIFITTPNLEGLRSRLEKGHWREATKKYHVVLFQERSLRNLLQAAGFTAIKRIRFSPVVNAGWKHAASARLQQVMGVGGSLCVLARAGS
jgi:2-polyprenyl-3-methyl-5-hydroxy-6-metoxy-1,4-benzoquinol methylase